MKTKMVMSLASMVVLISSAVAQSTDTERMERDIKVAENVLSTLIKQQFEKSNWMPIDVQGSYRSGFGVTLAVPNLSHFPVNHLVVPRAPRPLVKLNENGNSYSYSITTEEEHDDEDDEDDKESDEKIEKEIKKIEKEIKSSEKEREKAERDAKELVYLLNTDDPNGNPKENNKYTIAAAKNFLADYGSILSQLKSEERVLITNRNNNGENRYRRFMGDEKRYFLSVEATGADIKQYQSGKLSRDEFMNKIKVIESEVDSDRVQDLELLNTIIDRLYEPDLSKTYFTEDNTYYERLKDYGAIFYMQVYSSNQSDKGYYNMPTQKLEKLTEEERNKKVKEIYPLFEKELIENILEYGRTIKSLKPNEVLVFNVRLTKCKTCGIPSTLEITTKASVLNDYAIGKIDKNAALSKMEFKKGDPQ